MKKFGWLGMGYSRVGALSARENAFMYLFSFSETGGEALYIRGGDACVWIESK